MSYSLEHSPLYNDIVQHIYTYIRIPDIKQKSPTSQIIQPVLNMRQYLKKTKLRIETIMYSFFFTSVPSAWLLDRFNEQEWETHVYSNINHTISNRTIPFIRQIM